MKVRIRRISWPVITRNGQRITDVSYIAQVKNHWWSKWKYVTEDYQLSEEGEDGKCKSFAPLKSFRDIIEVKNYIKTQYVDRLCK